MSDQQTEGNALRAALASELERRRGHAPEPGEIFVLTETAELPVEWALLEAHAPTFLAVPADVQPLAGSRDLALGSEVLSGPLVLRCGHAVRIAASRLRPELRTGLLDPATLAAARGLHAALASGSAAQNPLGEEVDRDPEYRDWVEEVLDPARATMAGLDGDGEVAGGKNSVRGGAVVEMGDWREKRREKAERSERAGLKEWVRRGSPWLAAALLAVAVGLSWQEVRHLQRQLEAPGIDEPAIRLDSGALRGEKEIDLPPSDRRVRFSGEVPSGLSGPMSLVLVGRENRVVVPTPVTERREGEEWSLTLPGGSLSQGLFAIELRGPTGETLERWVIRVGERTAEP